MQKHFNQFRQRLADTLLLGLVLKSMAAADIRADIPHVITRLHAHHGHLLVKNALLQYIQATLHEAITIMISGPYPDNGIVIRDDIERYYRIPQ